MTRFDGRTVIVTGGARGMGASHARGFVAEGANVVIADVLEQDGRALAGEIGDRAIFARLDVTSDKDWAATVSAAEQAFGPVSVLVNNAGVVRFGAVAEIEPAVWRQVIDINLTGAYLGIRAVASSMRKAGGGAIVNISSAAGMMASPNNAAYVASKWGVGSDQGGGAGSRARQHPRQLCPPRSRAHADDGGAGRRRSDSGGDEGLGDSAHGRTGGNYAHGVVRRLGRGRLLDRGRVHRRWRRAARPGAGRYECDFKHRPFISKEKNMSSPPWSAPRP
jgi:hypothetical protein